MPDLSPLPADTSGRPTYGCLNNFAKVSKGALDLWLEILQRAPGSRLLLHVPGGQAQTAVRDRFARAGIETDRLELVGMQPWSEYIRTLERIDLALDPFPYGGGITTCDSLWMGVPVVSLAGQTAVGRGGCSILSNLGLAEFVAKTPKQYLEIAVSWINDRPRLRELRRGLRQRMENSPLRDARGFARAVENAYREMWRSWCNEGPP
jgi:predicted O-linked N-acetylglucosamine transferase (SPINDLY family)